MIEIEITGTDSLTDAERDCAEHWVAYTSEYPDPRLRGRTFLLFPDQAAVDAYLSALLDYQIELNALRKQVDDAINNEGWHFTAAFARRN